MLETGYCRELVSYKDFCRKRCILVGVQVWSGLTVVTKERYVDEEVVRLEGYGSLKCAMLRGQ